MCHIHRELWLSIKQRTVAARDTLNNNQQSAFPIDIKDTRFTRDVNIHHKDNAECVEIRQPLSSDEDPSESLDNDVCSSAGSSLSDNKGEEEDPVEERVVVDQQSAW